MRDRYVNTHAGRQEVLELLKKGNETKSLSYKKGGHSTVRVDSVLNL